MRYTARPVDGTGKATEMHDRRGPALSTVVGANLRPGTLNVRLDRAFLWRDCIVADIPDAVDWSRLDGPWTEHHARILRVTIGGVRAWAFRPLRSTAPADLVELLSDVYLRGAVSGWPAVLVAP